MTSIPTREDVKNAATYIDWAKATIGVPAPSVDERKILGKKARELFEQNPGTNWQTIVDVTLWCKQRKRRYPRVWQYVEQYRYAYAAGAIDIAVQLNDDLELAIEEALDEETDPMWRSRIRRAAGDEARERVLEEWRQSR